MKISLRLALALSILLASGSVLWLSAQNTNRQTTPPKRNQTTATHQPGNQADLAMSRQIRSAITLDRSLGPNAKNIKIMTKNGMVTLSGSVRSEEDKQAIEAKANEIAGADHVKSQIRVGSTAKSTPRKTTKRTPAN
jgi:hyperosmotically inducible periplasmic protein